MAKAVFSTRQKRLENNTDLTRVARALLHEVNVLRVDHGLAEVTWEEVVSQAFPAMEQSLESVAKKPEGEK